MSELTIRAENLASELSLFIGRTDVVVDLEMVSGTLRELASEITAMRDNEKQGGGIKAFGLAVCDAYGGDPNDAVWHTPEGIAGVLEDYSGLARSTAARMAAVEATVKVSEEERTRLLRLLVAECPAYPGIPNTCDAIMCDCFAADDLAATARTALTAAERRGAERAIAAMIAEPRRVLCNVYSQEQVESDAAWRERILAALFPEGGR